MQTRSQRYASVVHKQVSDIAEKYDSDEKDKEKDKEKARFKQQYGSMAQKLPVLIQTSGLAQALEFVNTRDKQDGKEREKPHLLLLHHIAEVVGMSSQELLDTSRTAELSTYMHLTQQVLASLLWYKRFAKSVLNVDQAEGD
jgi:CRISPR-associated protein Cmr5